MKLERLTERIWYFPFEEERDRPNLGYIRGDRWSAAVDAGHSDAHVAEFYAALEKEDLPLPALTVITHWHWDHTFGLHSVHGLSLANARTNVHLKEAQSRLRQNGTEAFLSLDDSIRKEYAGGRPMIIRCTDLEFLEKMDLDAGNCPIRVYTAPSPHTDDATFIEAPEEGVLFVGDADCEEFLTGRRDPVLAEQFEKTIRQCEAKVYLPGHWTPLTKRELLEG